MQDRGWRARWHADCKDHSILDLADEGRLLSIWAFAEKRNPVIGVYEREIQRQSRKHRCQLFDADMAGRHHNCAIFGHAASRGSGRRRGGEIPSVVRPDTNRIAGMPTIFRPTRFGYLYYWRNDYAGIEQYSASVKEGRTLLNTKLKREHHAFAHIWDANLKAQGFLEAFVRQQKDDT